MRLAICLLLLVTAAANAEPNQPSIDPFWIYTSPPSWHPAQAVGQFKTDPLNLVLLTPEGEYAESRVSLVRAGKHSVPHLDTSTLTITRIGHWTRTDDNAVRFTSQPVSSRPSDPTPPRLYENAQLVGKARNRLAAAIISKRQTLEPLPDISDPADLRTAIDRVTTQLR